jgi:peptidoglycan/LPS O-acetylase OafA/YrhL
VESRLSDDVGTTSAEKAPEAAPQSPAEKAGKPAKAGKAAATGTRKAAPEILTLTGLRCVASAWVVLDHLQIALFELFPDLKPFGRPVWSGYLSIEIFFLLSGFILAYNYAETVKTGASYRKFMWARVARIYPLYLVTAVIMGVLAFTLTDRFREEFGQQFPIDAPNAIANVFLLGSIPPFVPFDPPAWSLTCEFVAYFLFPVLAWVTLKLSPRGALAAACAVLAAGVLTMLAVSEYGGEWPWSYEGRWIRITCEFTAGMLLWAWWRAKARPSARWDLVAVASGLAVLFMIFAIDPGSPGTFTTLPLITLFVIACASATGPLGRLLASKPMQQAGELSFSLYLTHIIVLFSVSTVLPWKELVDAGLAVRIGWIVMVLIWMVGATLVAHHLIEKPARRRMLAWYGRRHPR